MNNFIQPFYKYMLATIFSLGLFSTELITNKANARPAPPTPAFLTHAQQFGEWSYLSEWNPPTLMWWNKRMDMVPVLYISFAPDKIILNAITPVWPDTGIIFYIKDNLEKQGLNLTLQSRDQDHCYYSAIIYDQDRQAFIDNLTSSRKARLITPSSYSQSLSLKLVNQAVKTLLTQHPELHLSLSASH